MSRRRWHSLSSYLFNGLAMVLLLTFSLSLGQTWINRPHTVHGPVSTHGTETSAGFWLWGNTELGSPPTPDPAVQSSMMGPTISPTSHNQPITILTYNMRSARDDRGVPQIDQVASILAKTGADVIALQEVDRYLPRSGWQNQARVLAKELGYVYALGANLGAGPVRYGTAVLSRFPIQYALNHPLPGRGEPRGLLEVQILSPRGHFTLLNTHLSLKRPAQRVQLKKVSEILSQQTEPVVLAGDLNLPPDATALRSLNQRLTDTVSNHHQLNQRLIERFQAKPDKPLDALDRRRHLKARQLSSNAVPAEARKTGETHQHIQTCQNRRTLQGAERDLCADYIYVSSHFDVKTTRILKETVSDHFPVLARVRLQPPEQIAER